MASREAPAAPRALRAHFEHTSGSSAAQFGQLGQLCRTLRAARAVPQWGSPPHYTIIGVCFRGSTAGIQKLFSLEVQQCAFFSYDFSYAFAKVVYKKMIF